MQYYINSESSWPNSQQLAAVRSTRHSPATAAKIFTVTTILSIFRRNICKPLTCQTPPLQCHLSSPPSLPNCGLVINTCSSHAHDTSAIRNLYSLLPSVNKTNCMNLETNQWTPWRRAVGKMRDAELNMKSAISVEPEVPMSGPKPSELQHILSQMNPAHYIFKIHFNIILLYKSTPSSYLPH